MCGLIFKRRVVNRLLTDSERGRGSGTTEAGGSSERAARGVAGMGVPGTGVAGAGVAGAGGGRRRKWGLRKGLVVGFRSDANDNSAVSWAISCPRNANSNSDGFISTANANDNSDGILSTYNADDNSNGLNSDLNAGSLIATSDNPRSHGTSGTGARHRDDDTRSGSRGCTLGDGGRHPSHTSGSASSRNSYSGIEGVFGKDGARLRSRWSRWLGVCGIAVMTAHLAQETLVPHPHTLEGGDPEIDSGSTSWPRFPPKWMYIVGLIPLSYPSVGRPPR